METLKKYTKKSGNKYFAVRHGEAEQNVKNLCDSTVTNQYHLTNKGIEQTKEAGEELKKQKIDLIISSPFVRTRETAEIIAGQIGLDKKDILIDDRLFEIRWGDFEGGSYTDYLAYEEKEMRTYDHRLPNGESYQDAKNRVGEFLYEVDEKYKDKNILFVSHGILLEVLPAIAEGADAVRSKEIIDNLMIKTGEVMACDFVRLPHNENFELDLHKPFIDNIILEKDNKEYKRVSEVMDVWFDSGAVPFAQDSEDRERPGDFSNISYPADFICEAIDQTRGWFYTMHAVGALMGRGLAYKNVICLGHLLDKEGKKMSKSIGNVVDPWESMDKHGVDAIRYWMYSINQPGESKNYDDKTVDEVNKRVFNLLDNIYSFYDLYRDKNLESKNQNPESQNVLDKWIITRLIVLTNLMTTKMDEYKLLEPTRALREFVDDLSTWYLRRSRDRIKEGDTEAKETLYFVLKSISKLLAPFAPFYAEDLYQKLRTESDVESVHLEKWPKMENKTETAILSAMEETRRLVTIAHELRSKSGIKVRQPLSKLTIKNQELEKDFLEVIKEELNVKEILVDKNIEAEVLLDTLLTPELLEEGKMRDAIRVIQDMRKEKNLKPSDVMSYAVNIEDKDLFEKFRKEIISATNIEF